MANPIFDSPTYRRDIAEARALEDLLAEFFFELKIVRKILTGARLDPRKIELTGSTTAVWVAILDFAASRGAIEELLASVEENLRPAPRDQAMWTAIDRVRQVTEATGSLATTRLLLSNDRPFLGRTKLRGLLSELRNWKPGASILVVRGDPDSGRTETQSLVDEGRDEAREVFVLLHEELTFESSLTAIWVNVNVTGNLPSFGSEPLTTESAALMEFWIRVKATLTKNQQVLWVVFDDLDKGPGRVAVRMMAEVLAIQLRDVSFQRCIRLVMLGYPDPQLPSKVTAGLVREDETDKINTIDVSHVLAFIDYCTKASGKSVADPDVAANDILTKAKANTSAKVPYLQALNGALSDWYKAL